MHDDDVPQDEMRWNRPYRDEIDAVLSDDVVDGDLTDVARIVHDVRSAYLSTDHLTRSAALTAFTETRLGDAGQPSGGAASDVNGPGVTPDLRPGREATQEGHRSMFRALTAVTTGVTGKILLGGAVAAASVGGLQAAAVVDVPGLPDPAPRPAFVQSGDDTEDETATDDETTTDDDTATDDGTATDDETATDDGTVTGQDPEHLEFVAAMQAWSECVDEASALRDEETAEPDASGGETPGRFDPEEACGERPVNPNARPHDSTPNGPPASTPNGPPADRPNGPPASTPNGPPADRPNGPPADTPNGPPAGRP